MYLRLTIYRRVKYITANTQKRVQGIIELAKVCLVFFSKMALEGT